jgi:hypothetical protein
MKVEPVGRVKIEIGRPGDEHDAEDDLHHPSHS